MRQQPIGSLFQGSSSWKGKWFVPKGLHFRVIHVLVLNGVQPKRRADSSKTRWAEALAQEFANLANEDGAVRPAVY